MGISRFLRERRDDILRIAAKHGVYSIRIFGSAARGEEAIDSDLDFLVTVGPNPSPWFPAGLVVELEELLGRKVDVVTEDSVYWLLRRRILKEAVPL
ncbi:MAG: nucleotidyltransferase family protein [Deltaproteobacteria bacterium]|nr:nucleotidyltransferase family protein [Deltaproteobacteria bacterium]